MLLRAIDDDEVERFRPLLPVGYSAGAAAYRRAVEHLGPRELSTHYTEGLEFFHHEFVPCLKTRLSELSGGVWSFDEYEAFAAGSDVDFMTHLVEAVAARDPVHLFPGDWHGFLVGATQTNRIAWNGEGGAGLACLCVPSVRNGHLTADMVEFLQASSACLLNLNLYPTLESAERRQVGRQLTGLLEKSVLSISFSRGFGLTASQLGVALVHRDHPYCRRFARQWNWLTYFYNALAARAFMAIDLKSLEEVDRLRRQWVHDWLNEHNIPAVTTGSYYVKSFRAEGDIPPRLRPLVRGDVLRLCFKPPHT